MSILCANKCLLNHNVNEFPAFTCPGKEAVMSIHEMQFSPMRVSLKVLVYMLDRELRQTLDRLLYLGDSLDFLDDVNPYGSVLRLCKHRFAYIRKHVDSLCEDCNYKVEHICIPTLHFTGKRATSSAIDDICCEAVFAMFPEVPKSNVGTVGEAYAMSRCLVEDFGQDQRNLGRELRGRKVLMFADLGGTALGSCSPNRCVTQISTVDGKIATAVSRDVCLGCFGGSEVWELLVAGKPRNYLNLPLPVIEGLLSNFSVIKSGIQNADEPITLSHGGNNYRLPGKEAVEAFDRAFKNPINLLLDKIKALLRKEDPKDIAILMSGGSFRHKMIAEEVQRQIRLCAGGREISIVLPQRQGKWHIEDSPGLIARGAALAVTSRKTVEECILSDPAFGFQLGRQHTNQRETEVDVKLVGRNTFIDGSLKTYPGPGERLSTPAAWRSTKLGIRILCDPHYTRRGCDGHENISFNSCYDFYQIPPEDIAERRRYRVSGMRIDRAPNEADV
ncbi:hypothetical protein PspLS_11522 [Pyricularia sp. CBS 133598]|nr:hypothetical protein PspLS_11522 [Pyricularia sp. CBS 133598]